MTQSSWSVFLLAGACACSSGGGGAGTDAGTGGTDAATGGTAGSGGTSGTGGSAGSAGSGGASGAGGASGNPVVEFETTLGTMAIELYADRLPATTANFLSYVDEGFYPGTIFHRVIPGFVIQGGGFETGMVAKSTKAPIALEIHPEVTHVYGAISMARTDVPDSATSQFFVVNDPAGEPSLDGAYAAFGKLIEGSAVLDAISAVQTTTQRAHQGVPVTDVVVLSAQRR